MDITDEINILVTRITEDKLNEYRLEEELLVIALKHSKISLEKKTKIVERIKFINKKQLKLLEGKLCA